ncbi:glycoside hydrolase family 9 protein [Pedosphaera parvula]|uniref:Glycoside hydrolase family 9 domain protein Ig domain protein n=1 Tax=Pedosphaera parvula (strain Ellin514) TaxID=320771 RepID=B9XER6_PEDPL|nr:glycoside hydrolase family 9 protein [Pedosphaera parvula]EEF61780.1 glycoside hydrolase family 9 domain protein Ig domain protein [Pedosphaera parvula Ellin514]
MQKKCFVFRSLVSTLVRPRLKNRFKPLSCGRGFLAALLVPGFLNCASAAIPLPIDIQTPAPGDHALRILSPNLLELFLVNTKQPDPARVNDWDWVNDQQTFVSPDMSSVRVIVNGQTNLVTGVGFKRRPLYAPLLAWDLRIGNQLYLQLSNSIAAGAAVQVINNGTLWPTNMAFRAAADTLRFNPAIHVNQEGYLPSYPKKAAIGYYLGDLGEMTIPANQFSIVNASSGTTVYQGTLTLRPDVGYNYTPTPYRKVYEADFSSLTTPGEYRLAVPGMGASLPFRVDDGIAMAFARTYALGMFHQRGGFAVDMPFTRFTHAADHLAPASVPTNASAPFAFTWQTVSNYCLEVNSDNPPQTAPALTNYSTQLYPFVNQGTVSVSGGHFEAGDYNRVTYNGAQLVHTLVFAADSLPGVGALDNLGIPESGDGISDVLQEAKWEADFLARMQDADGGFYYSVYPQFREYELDVLPENGDPQVVWPKNTGCTAAAVAALAQCASSPRFKQAYPQVASNYWAKAQLGWQFLTNAIARFGLDGSYQKVQHFDDDFTHHDELAWAACEMFLASGDPQYQAKLFEWFPNPTDFTTFRWGWLRMYACYGNAVRDYAFAVRNGRLSNAQIQQDYLEKCINVITNCGNDILSWSQDNAYGTSFPDLSKAYRGGGWYFSSAQAFDMVVAYQFNPDPQYVDALLRNLNFESGCNPVNVSYITGLGWKRLRNIVDQYSLNDRRALPKDGIPISNLQTGFQPTWVYGWELSGLTYPSDNVDTSPYPYYDRWCDDWNVSTEGSTTDTARSFAGLVWLAAQTPLASQLWRSTNASIIAPTTASLPNQPVTVTLNVADTNLSTARIMWEASGQEPAFGSQNYTFSPGSQAGTYWIEAEVQWPDGRRAFATNSITVSPNAPPFLSQLQKVFGGGFTFVLTGTPMATYIIQSSADLVSWNPLATNALPANGVLTITDPQSGSASRRYYRALKSP